MMLEYSLSVKETAKLRLKSLTPLLVGEEIFVAVSVQTRKWEQPG